jgi:hypothetical protein
MAILAGSANAAITVDSSYSGPLTGGAANTFNIDLSSVAFDAGGSDKLVVMVGARGSGGNSFLNKYLLSMTWGATPMTEAVTLFSDENGAADPPVVYPGGNNSDTVGIYYLDNPGAATTLQIEFQGKVDGGSGRSGFTLVALSGTAEGVGPTNATLDYTPPSSTDLTITKPGTFVVAAGASSGNQGAPVSPLTEYALRVNYASGWQVASGGAITPTFEVGTVVAAAAFEDAHVDPNIPDVYAGDAMITWSGQAVQLAPTITEKEGSDWTDLTYLWTAEPADGVVFTDPVNPGDPNTSNAEAPTVTITKATDNPSVVTLTLAVNSLGRTGPPVPSTMTIDVYDDSCKAAEGAGTLVLDPTDFDANCITNLKDFAVMAAKWLDDYSAEGPVPK